jgi:sec-independent protein translocase protein TatC
MADTTQDDFDPDGIAADETKMPLLEHLLELRTRLIYCFVALIIMFFIAYGFSEHIYAFLVQPLADIMHKSGGQRRLIYTALHEAFFTYLKVSFFAAMFVSFPFIAMQFWRFVAPGLYKHEKRTLAPFLVATPVLFFMGGALVYYLIFPMAWQFFLGFETTGVDGSLPIQLEAKVDQYLSLVMQLIFAFGLCFELPVVITLLARIGIVNSKGLRAKRKYAIVIAFVAAAILTPPDVISQIGLAVPTIMLYEISIWCARLVEKGRGDEPEEEDDDLDDDDDEDEKDAQAAEKTAPEPGP